MLHRVPSQREKIGRDVMYAYGKRASKREGEFLMHRRAFQCPSVLPKDTVNLFKTHAQRRDPRCKGSGEARVSRLFPSYKQIKRAERYEKHGTDPVELKRDIISPKPEKPCFPLQGNRYV